MLTWSSTHTERNTTPSQQERYLPSEVLSSEMTRDLQNGKERTERNFSVSQSGEDAEGAGGTWSGEGTGK